MVKICSQFTPNTICVESSENLHWFQHGKIVIEILICCCCFCQNPQTDTKLVIKNAKMTHVTIGYILARTQEVMHRFLTFIFSLHRHDLSLSVLAWHLRGLHFVFSYSNMSLIYC